MKTFSPALFCLSVAAAVALCNWKSNVKISFAKEKN